MTKLVFVIVGRDYCVAKAARMSKQDQTEIEFTKDVCAFVEQWTKDHGLVAEATLEAKQETERTYNHD